MHRACLALLLLCLALPVDAGQRLIGPGDDWSSLASVAPGDELILMPGRHKPGLLEKLSGKPGNPIVVRSLAPDRETVIEAEREGLSLVGSRHVLLRDLTIEGATINGLTIAPPPDHDPATGPWPAHVRLHKVTVRRTGPTGRRHGVHVTGVSHVQLDQCTIEGWGGAAVDVVASSEVQITKCTLTGLDDHSQQSGVHLRGGASDVRITDCVLVESGLFPLKIGGPGDPRLTVTGEVITAEGTSGAIPASGASSIQIARCVVRGGGYPLHFVTARGCRVRNMTIVEPEHGVVAIDLGPAGSPPPPSADLELAQSLIVWQPDTLDQVIRTGPNFSAETLTLSANLWWSPSAEGGEATFAWPVSPAAPQVVDVDPRLDDQLAPQTARAALFGAFAP